jgi:hypothetical protein
MKDESGQSLIEALLLGLVVLVPLLWALGVLADLHRTALATTAAAREAGFDAGSSTSVTDAQEAASEAVERALVDHGLDPRSSDVDLALGQLTRGSTIEIRVAYPVTVLQAPLLGRVTGPSIWVDARHSAIVDPYRSRD